MENKWLKAFGLERRSPPELYKNLDEATSSGHATAIRTAFKEVGLSAIFCIQDVPTIGYLKQENYDPSSVLDIHAKLWNQGLLSLLVVMSGECVRIFSLSKVPSNTENSFESNCLIKTLDLTLDFIEINNVLSGVETGRLWQEHKDFFPAKNRIDYHLLNNLVITHRKLVAQNLESMQAQALLMQTMFISYLEDRGVIGESYFGSVKQEFKSFKQMLKSGDLDAFNRLFLILSADFNGDIFVSPSSFDKCSKLTDVSSEHLETLARFRMGNQNLESGQYYFWGYDFKFIPVELLSSVYDMFLGEDQKARKDKGAFYTPMHLADSVVVQLWDTLTVEQKSKGSILDPACGSGIFLVKSFQLICEQWRLEKNVQNIQWSTLCYLLKRIHGRDINIGAVRVAIFSLYIALLEQTSPPDLKKLIKKGKLLPSLWEENLIAQDFFTEEEQPSKFDIIIGNPPWASRKGINRSSISWCKSNGYLMPGNEDSWAFTWKSLEHLYDESSVIAFLLPSMGFLHNPKSFDARAKLFEQTIVNKIINFSDLRFQLFDGAISATSLIILKKKNEKVSQGYLIDYWCPKAAPALANRRNILISSLDKKVVHSSEVINDYFVLKKKLWMRRVDERLFKYLSSYPSLSELIHQYKHVKNKDMDNLWVIGQGFQPHTSGAPKVSNVLKEVPYIDIDDLTLVRQCKSMSVRWETEVVRRKGFEFAYDKKKVLISRGVGTAKKRLQATYCDFPSSFKDILMAITFPESDSLYAKILTAFLNSKLALWYSFHGTSSFGSSIPEVKPQELIKLPFPSISELERDSKDTCDEIEALLDKYGDSINRDFQIDNYEEFVLEKIDELIYKLFGLSEEEIHVIEDTVNFIIPASQASRNSKPQLWKYSTDLERKSYLEYMKHELENWFSDDVYVSNQIVGMNLDFVIVEISLKSKSSQKKETELNILDDFGLTLERVGIELTGNFMLLPDFRMFVGDKLYMVKPTHKRFWLKSAALDDADSIAIDLQTALQSQVHKE